MKREKNTTEFPCPVCGVEMLHVMGNKIHPGDKNYGVSLICSRKECASTEEVCGHGDKAKDAYEIAVEKFSRLKN